MWFCLCVECAEQEREVQKSYWIEHSVDLTLEAMMLDSKAADLDKEERPEVYFFDKKDWCSFSLNAHDKFIILNAAMVFIDVYFILCFVHLRCIWFSWVYSKPTPGQVYTGYIVTVDLRTPTWLCMYSCEYERL